MLATWLAVLLFLFAMQCLFVVKLADRLTVSEAGPAVRDAKPVASAEERYAQAA